MTLQLTHHAVERFIGRYRHGASRDEARTELQALAAEATATRRRTLAGDAWVYLTLSGAGERIGLAVRDGVVITVLPGGVGDPMDLSPSEELMEESRAMVAECQAIAKVGAVDEAGAPKRTAADARRESAMELLREWRAGGEFTVRAIRRAHKTLGLPYVEAPRLEPTAWCVTRAYGVKRTMPDGSTEVHKYVDTFEEAQAALREASAKEHTK